MAGEARCVARVVRGVMQRGSLRMTGDSDDREPDEGAEGDGDKIRRDRHPALRLSGHAFLPRVARQPSFSTVMGGSPARDRRSERSSSRNRSADRSESRSVLSPFKPTDPRAKPRNTIPAHWSPSSAPPVETTKGRHERRWRERLVGSRRPPVRYTAICLHTRNFAG